MKKQTHILSAVVIFPVLLGSTAWAADKSRDAYAIAPDGGIVRSASGECVHTPGWTAAVGGDCAGATRAAVPAPVVVKTEAAAKPAETEAAPVTAAAPVAAPPVVVAAPAAAPEIKPAPVIDTAPAMVSVAPVTVKTKPAVENVTLSGAALFEFDRAELKPGAQKQLTDLAGKVKSQKDLDEVVISGYADATGPEAYNEELSKKRAESVKAFLLQQGIVSKRVVIQALGEEKPVASNDTPEGRAQNRRVEVSIKATVSAQ